MSPVRERSPIVFLVIACALWGGATVLSKHLLTSLPPVTLLVLQLAPSAFTLWLIVVVTQGHAFDKRALVPLILLGFLNPGLSYTLSLLGLVQISAGIATLLWAAEPIMILALAGVILHEPINARLLAVMLVGASGVLLITGAFEPGQIEVAWEGVLLMLGAVLCCAVYTVFSRKVGANVDPLLTASIQQTAGLIWAACLLPLEDGDDGMITHLAAIPWLVTAIAALSGLLYYAAAYWLYLSALKTVPAAVAGSFFNLIPAVGIILAFLFLGERLTLLQLLGTGAIMASVFLLVRWNSPREIAARGHWR